MIDHSNISLPQLPPNPHSPTISQNNPHCLTFNTNTILRSKKEAECCAAGLALSNFNENPPPKRTKCFSQPSRVPSLLPPSAPGVLYLTYKENESWVEDDDYRATVPGFKLRVMILQTKKELARLEEELGKA